MATGVTARMPRQFVRWCAAAVAIVAAAAGARRATAAPGTTAAGADAAAPDAAAPGTRAAGAAAAAPAAAASRHDAGAPENRSPRPGLAARVDAIAAEVARLRGLPLRRPLRRRTADAAAVRAYVARVVARGGSAGDAAAEARALARMGLLPDAQARAEAYVDALAREVVGFYDPWQQTLYVVDRDPSPADAQIVVAHEVGHALQDQHFDLRAFIAGAGAHNGDAALARQALVEGDGMAVTIEYAFAQVGADPPWGDPSVVRRLAGAFAAAGGASRTGRLADAPLAVRSPLSFPYTAGLAFVARYRTFHSWQRIDQMYRQPPLSTEHILHPETYAAYERPDEVTVRPLRALADYRVTYRNVLGEFGFRVWLRQLGAPAYAASAAADGWGGDRIALYEPAAGAPGRPIVAVYSVWDDEIDAIELVDALAGGLAAFAAEGARSAADRRIAAGQHAHAAAASRGRDAGTGALAADGVAAVRDARGDVYLAARRGDAVVIVLGAPAGRATAIVDEMWRRWRVTRH
ncbi:MAG: hypothetical protein D6689_15515 [Deltaproteobacteria bacterium]|nr:MAG: hypothetical protein D6689_15515 [Deltaproteobacteria bacterium]